VNTVTDFQVSVGVRRKHIFIRTEAKETLPIEFLQFSLDVVATVAFCFCDLCVCLPTKSPHERGGGVGLVMEVVMGPNNKEGWTRIFVAFPASPDKCRNITSS
jgi:hypothetical protein